jgi:cobaltochelatase CobS
MAGKAMNVIRVDCTDMTAVVQFPNGREYPYQIRNLDKNTLIAMYSRVFDRKWTGKPMAKTVDEIRNTIMNTCNEFAARGECVIVAKPLPQPTQPTLPTSAPTASPSVPTGDKVANAVRDVIQDALRSVGVDENAVKQLIESALVDERSHVRELLRDVRPLVTNVVLPTGETRPVTGLTHEIFPKVLRAVACGEHVWMTGSAGVGKSKIARQVAESLGVAFSAEPFNSQSSKADIKGYKAISDNLYQSTGFRDRYEHGGVFLMDEIDASNPNILTVLNDALSNDSMSFPDGMVQRHPQFVAIAAANTWGNGATAEYVGRAPIDGATIDRFTMMHVKIDERLETELVRGTGLDMEHGSTWLNIVRTARRNVDTHGLKVIVSPRASIGGAKLLAGGFTWQDAIDMRLLKGVKPDIMHKVMENLLVPSGAPVEV